MRLRKNIIVLDTETTGDFKQPLVHDIGYVIIDKDFHILKTVRYLVKNVRDCLWALNYSEFYRSKSMLYDLEIENGKMSLISKDIGPGIADKALVMQEGYSTAPESVRAMGFGAGMGLPNAKRHSHNFSLESEVGKGTVITADYYL